MGTHRYGLIAGDEFWIIDHRHPERNPLFRLRPRDGAHARELLRNLRRIPSTTSGATGPTYTELLEGVAADATPS